MRKKFIIIILIIGVISTGICWRIYNHYNPSSVLICVPNDYRGQLTIKEDAQEGQMPDGKAFENFGDYVYEFYEINQETVFVKNMIFLLNAEIISASEISVAPLGLKLLYKNKDERFINVEILDYIR